MEKILQEKKSPVIPIIALIAGGLSVILVLTLTPWNIMPTQVSEDITVIAVTEYGCVGESELGVNVVVSQCDAAVGDTVTATFNVPVMVQNGYYDRIEAKLDIGEP